MNNSRIWYLQQLGISTWQPKCSSDEVFTLYLIGKQAPADAMLQDLQRISHYPLCYQQQAQVDSQHHFVLPPDASWQQTSIKRQLWHWLQNYVDSPSND